MKLKNMKCQIIKMQCRLLRSHKYFLLRGKKKKMTRKTEWGRTEKKSEEAGKVEGKGEKERRTLYFMPFSNSGHLVCF